jgi:hypothetical protein
VTCSAKSPRERRAPTTLVAAPPRSEPGSGRALPSSLCAAVKKIPRAPLRFQSGKPTEDDDVVGLLHPSFALIPTDEVDVDSASGVRRDRFEGLARPGDVRRVIVSLAPTGLDVEHPGNSVPSNFACRLSVSFGVSAVVSKESSDAFFRRLGRSNTTKCAMQARANPVCYLYCRLPWNLHTANRFSATEVALYSWFRTMFVAMWDSHCLVQMGSSAPSRRRPRSSRSAGRSLVVRELLSGSTRFNDIRRGVPLISPALFSQRLSGSRTKASSSATPRARPAGTNSPGPGAS